jgi:hypothetical protein
MANMVEILRLNSIIDEETLQEFATKAAKNISATLNDLGLPESATNALTKVNLFEAIF